MANITIDMSLTTIVCCACGSPFAIEESKLKSLKETKDTFYCPNGHSQVFSKSTAEYLQEKLNAEKAIHEQTKRALAEAIKARDEAMYKAAKKPRKPYTKRKPKTNG